MDQLQRRKVWARQKSQSLSDRKKTPSKPDSRTYVHFLEPGVGEQLPATLPAASNAISSFFLETDQRISVGVVYMEGLDNSFKIIIVQTFAEIKIIPALVGKNILLASRYFSILLILKLKKKVCPYMHTIKCHVNKCVRIFYIHLAPPQQLMVLSQHNNVANLAAVIHITQG